MRLDLGLVMGIFLECVLMVYYADTMFCPKQDYIKSGIGAAVGYAIMLVINILGYPILSIAMFIVINFAVLMLFYRVGYKTALFTAVMLDVISVVGEYMVVAILSFDHSLIMQANIIPYESIVLTLSSKLLSFAGMVIVKHSVKKVHGIDNNSTMVLLLIPVITVVCMTIMLYSQLSYPLFWVMCIMLFIINIITFAVNDIVRLKNNELQEQRAEKEQYKLKATEYQLISQQYENMRIMNHDFNKQMHIIAALTKNDKERLEEYLNNLQDLYEKNDYRKFTDNVILNILLLQKIRECEEKQIDFQISTLYGKYDFISETDTVAIFANLIDNAIEACEKSEKKYIFMDLYATNGVFPSVKIENSSDREPKMRKGQLVTSKADHSAHGWGTRSIERTAEQYGGMVDWSYNKSDKSFRSVIVFNPSLVEQKSNL